MVTEFSREWLEFYSKAGVIDVSPILGLLSSHHAPFTWTQLREEDPRSPVRRHIFGAARALGLTEGLVVPLPRGGTRRGLICLHGSRDALTADEIKFLTTVSVLYYERVKGLLAGVQRPRTATLTPRELDCLSYVARGLNDSDIGERLGIAATTAHDHVERAKRRLGVRSRAEAVAVAVSLALITP